MIRSKSLAKAVVFSLGFATFAGGIIFSEQRTTAAATCVVTNSTTNGENTIRINYPSNTDSVNGCDWYVPAGVTGLKVALVGGGGGAGLGWAGGGGGGGQVQYNDSLAVTPGQSFNIVIGQGGAKKTATNRAGNSGTQTKFGSVTALGGGGGGGSNSYWSTAGNIGLGMSAVGLSGGSGGGNNVFGNGASGTTRSSAVANTFAGWTAFGNPGGLAVSNGSFGSNATWGAGSGGGGAYEAGTDSANNNGAVTLGRAGRGVLLLGACLGGGGESNYQGAAPSGLTYGSSVTTQQACVSPDGLTTGGTSGALYQQPATANSGGGGGGYAISTFADYYPGADGTVVIRYSVPTPVFTSSSLTNLPRPMISGTAPTGSTVQLIVGGATYTTSASAGTWSVNTSTATPTSGSLSLNVNGENVVVASVIDTSGGVSDGVAQYLTIDTSAPNAPAFSSNSSLTNLTNRSITFTSDSSGTATCSLDMGAFSACASPFVTGELADGTHILRIKSTDAAGNTSSIASYGWTIDATAPLAPIVTSAISLTQSSSVTLGFTGEAGAVASCSINGNPWVACSSGNTHSGFTDGNHNIRVRLTDAAGNTGTSATYSWTRDSVAPAAPVRAQTNGGPSGRSNNTGAVFNFTSELLSTNQCRHSVDGTIAIDWTSCQSGFALSNLVHGLHQLSVRATDSAGNVSESLTYSWEVDTQGPGQPNIDFSNNLVSLSGGLAGVSGDRYEFKLVDANNNILQPWGTASSSPFALRVSNGSYQLFARLVDDLGNIGSAVTQTVTVSNQPEPPVSSTPRLVVDATDGYATSSTLDIEIDWPIGTKSVRLLSTQNSNGGSGTLTELETDWQSAGDRKSLTWNFTPAGVPTVTATHTLTAEFLDAAGAVINTQLTSVIIDVQAPTLTSAIPTSISNATLPIQITASDEAGGSGLGDVLVARTPAGITRATSVTWVPYQIVSGYITVPNVTLGETMEVRISDRAGNISASAFTVSALNRQTLKPIAKFTGSAKVGQTLKLSAGTWPKTHRVTYQWRADGVNIAGATKSTFKLTSAQAGKRITVAVTGTRSTYYPTTVYTPSSAMVTGGTLTSATPTITGSTIVGQTLTAATGTWINNPTITYVWKRGSTTIGNALTYTLTNQDAGQKLTFTVTASKPGFKTATKTATTTTITGGTITEQVVTVSRAIVKGKKVYTANSPTWGPGTVSLAYQWLRNGTPISKATSKTYTAVTADLGQNLSVRVTGTKTGFTTRITFSLETLVQ